MADEPIFRISLHVPTNQLEHAEALLEQSGMEGYSSWEQADVLESELVFYFEDKAAAESTATRLRNLFHMASDFKGIRVVLESVASEDWSNAWKKFFHTSKVSKRVVVGPSWEEWQGDPGLIRVVIDPGMSFGTGLHPTTRSCIGFIDDAADSSGSGSFFDAGCGSGILSICAAKLGFARISGIDIDPHAVECAKQNAALNGVKGLQFLVASLEDVGLGERYDMAVVNILEPVIRKNVERIVSLVAPGGKLVLSGLLTTQFADVAKVFVSHGMQHIEQQEEGEWTSGLFISR